MPKEQVIASAKNALAWVKDYRQKKLDKYIDAALTYRRWFKKYTRTREEAEAYVRQTADVWDSVAWTLPGWQEKNMAEELLSACAVAATETVTLNRKEADLVNRYK